MTCACQHVLELPRRRDAILVVAPGISQRHGRSHCTEITLGAQRNDRVQIGRGDRPAHYLLPARRDIRFALLERIK